MHWCFQKKLKTWKSSNTPWKKALVLLWGHWFRVLRSLCSVFLHTENILFNSILSSYISDISWCKDMLAMIRGRKTSSPCHNCLLKKAYLHGTIVCSKGLLLKPLVYWQQLKTAHMQLGQSFKTSPYNPFAWRFINFCSLACIVLSIYTCHPPIRTSAIIIPGPVQTAERVPVLLIVRSAAMFKCNTVSFLATECF